MLLHGPPGTRQDAGWPAPSYHESDAQFFLINGPEIMGSAYGESESRLREIFEEASKARPRSSSSTRSTRSRPTRSGEAEAEKRLVAQLLTLMDGPGGARQSGVDRRDQPARGSMRRCAGPAGSTARSSSASARRARAAPRSWASMRAACRWRQGRSGRAGAHHLRVRRRGSGALAREAAIEAVRRIMPRSTWRSGPSPPRCSTLCRSRARISWRR